MSGISGIGSASSIQQIIALRQQLVERSEVLQQIHGPAPAALDAKETFGDALRSALDGVSGAQNRAEGLSAAYERGEVNDVASVMLARQEAGVAFEATLQVRNRLLTAYQDIMRMGA